MANDNESKHLGLGYEVFIAIVSILSIFNMVLPFVPGIDPDAAHVVTTINVYLTLLFVLDFGVRLYLAPSRRQYFFRDYGWADLLGIRPRSPSLPALPGLQRATGSIQRYSTKRFLGLPRRDPRRIGRLHPPDRRDPDRRGRIGPGDHGRERLAGPRTSGPPATPCGGLS